MMYSGGGSKAGNSKNELRNWKHAMGLKTSAKMNKGIRMLHKIKYDPRNHDEGGFIPREYDGPICEKFKTRPKKMKVPTTLNTTAIPTINTSLLYMKKPKSQTKIMPNVFFLPPTEQEQKITKLLMKPPKKKPPTIRDAQFNNKLKKLATYKFKN